MLFRTIVGSLALVGGWGAEMCGGNFPLSGTCSQGVAMPILPVDAFTYVTMAAAGDQFEIQSSQIALAKAASLEVRNFAQTLIQDHTQMSAKLTAAAAQSGLIPPLPVLTADQQQMLSDLQAASALNFDQIFLRDQIVAHQMALALHSNYATKGDTLALRAVAASAVPIIQMHLTNARQLSVQQGGMMDSCPANYWCHSDFNAQGTSFSVCCPSDVSLPLFPPASLPMASFPAPSIYATATFPTSNLYAPAVNPAPIYATATFPTSNLYAPAGNSLTSGWINAFGTTVYATRIPSIYTGFGNIPVGAAPIQG